MIPRNLLKMIIPTLNNFNSLKQCVKHYNNISIEDIPEISAVIIKQTFNRNSIAFEEGCTCFRTKCFICKQPKTTKSKPCPRLYINKTTGMYLCSFCGHNGQFDQLRACINAAPSEKPKDSDRSAELEKMLKIIQDETVPIKELDESNAIKMFEKFQLPVATTKLIESLDIRLNDKLKSLYFPLENVDNKIVGYRVVHCANKDEKILPDIQTGGLLTAHLPNSKDTAVVVPSIADFLVLLNQKLNVNIVCLPQGINTLSQFVLPSLERFKKLILWLGSDDIAWNSAKHFARKLGEKRCYLIRPNELLPHIKEQQDFKSVLSKAHAFWHKSITTFGSLRGDILLDLQNITKVEGVKWQRFQTLNKILKGHRRGELTILTGPTGSGKTTFVSEYSLDLAMQGVNTLWGSFEIKNTRLAQTMLQQMAGFPLQDNLQLFDVEADKFEKLPIYFMTFQGQQTIKVVLEAVEHATYVHDIAHVIIDNLQFMMGLSENKYMDRFFLQDVIVAAFRTFATKKNCHVTLIIHPRKEDDNDLLTNNSIFGGAKATQEADNVLIIQNNSVLTQTKRKYLQVTKNRFSGDLGIMALDFNKKSLSFEHKELKSKNKNNDADNTNED